MKFIEFDRHKCDECYKCLRTCPTKAIIFTEDRRDIADNMCIKCGLCQASCPQEALTIQNDRYKIIKHMRMGKKIVVSLAPSFAGAFELDHPLKIVTGIKQLGTHIVEETGVAAEIVSQMYAEEIEKADRSSILTTCCPSANALLQSHYPELLEHMLPVTSPMVTHGRMLKQKYGPDAFVVFIGPCLAKKAEAEAFSDAIDAVLTFNELDQWFKDEHIDLASLQETPMDSKASLRGMSYPLGGSLFAVDGKSPLTTTYQTLRIEGIERCRSLFKTLGKGSLDHFLVELNICNGSCINGPDMPVNDLTFFERKQQLSTYIAGHKSQEILSKEDQTLGEQTPCHRIFNNTKVHLKTPSQEEIQSILNKIDKYAKKDELNCGSCGYETCRDKAIAVFNDLSKNHMCLPYLRTKAESLSSAIFEHTPNLICILDQDLQIQEYSPTFHSAFRMDSVSLKGLPISAFMNEAIFKQALETKTSVIGQVEVIPALDQIYYCNAIYTDKILLGIMTDITLFEKNRQELLKVKEKTLHTCQAVIDKQMRVAQEIASLLGETTAETKVGLNNLRDLILKDTGYSYD